MECVCAFCDESAREGALCLFCSRVCSRPWPGFEDMALWCLHRMKRAAELEGSLPAHLAVDAEVNGTLDHVVRLAMEERANARRFKEKCNDESE